MNILFLTMNNFESITEHSIYPDLIRCFRNHGHSVVVVTPLEKRMKKETEVLDTEGIKIIKARTGNLFNVNMLTKLISRATVGAFFYKAINQNVDTSFDLVLYSTPPTTFFSIVRKIKKRDNAVTYLMLKDIFPQNAADLGMIHQNGFLFRIFRNLEKKLYQESDYIGCMSEANIKFLLNQDKWIDPKKVELCPNSLEIRLRGSIDRERVLRKYAIPDNKVIFIYGGGMGKPQGIEFLIECVKKMSTDTDIHFVISGSGPYLQVLKELHELYPQLLSVLDWMPVDEYEKIVEASDVGLVFLNHQFTIPNYPSRVLTYMQSALPILAATDISSDVGKDAEIKGYGFWCESRCGNESEFIKCVNKFKDKQIRKIMGEKSRRVFEQEYDVENSYYTIMKHLCGE